MKVGNECGSNSKCVYERRMERNILIDRTIQVPQSRPLSSHLLLGGRIQLLGTTNITWNAVESHHYYY